MGDTLALLGPILNCYPDPVNPILGPLSLFWLEELFEIEFDVYCKDFSLKLNTLELPELDILLINAALDVLLRLYYF